MFNKAEKIFNIFEEKIPELYKTTAIRETQVQMALDICSFLDRRDTKKILFIEAPVGTGKSLGALVPTLMQTRNLEYNKVLYATATINLQGQLMNSEVPLLKKLNLVEHPILAKGKTHYYCHKKMTDNIKNISEENKQFFYEFFKNGCTGQRNEFEDLYELELPDKEWKKVSMEATKKECDSCSFSFMCLTKNQREQFKALKNDLIITNHDQLIVSTINKLSEPIRNTIVPIDPGIIIIDEAHDFIENFLGRLEQNISIRTLKNAQRVIDKKNKFKYQKLVQMLETKFIEKSKLIEGSLQGRYKIPKDFNEILIKLNEIINSALIQESLTQSISRNISYEVEPTELDELSVLFKNIFSDDYVKWLNLDEMKFGMISERFPLEFKKTIDLLTLKNKVIIMSGTLTNNGDFDALFTQWRINKNDAIGIALPTSFDYANQALVYIPSKIENPNKPNYLEGNIDIIKGLVNLTDGRSLILATSKDQMGYISKELRTYLTGKNLNLYVQEEADVEVLTKKFKIDEESVLVGSGSFFSGFSVPGNALISVILNKLPFPVPDDPFLELIGQGFEDEFFDLVIFPHMINKLNQAAGRLIRDINDFGLFTILDSRIFTKEYGKAILSVLTNQGYKITRSREDVERFLTCKIKKGSEADYLKYNRDKLIVHEYLLEVPPVINRGSTTNRDPFNKFSKLTNYRIDDKETDVTYEQEAFAKALVKKFGLKNPTSRHKSSVDKLFTYLIEKFYFDFEDTQIIYDEFPYRDEEEKKRLSKIIGSKRKVVTWPNCTQFGCNGLCNAEIRKSVEEGLYSNSAIESINLKYNDKKGCCTVIIEPLSVVAKEFNK